MVKPGGPRVIELFGNELGKVAVLAFASSDLSYRHWRAQDAGCSWDWDDYTPHITFADAPANAVDMSGIEPWTGAIELGPEVFEEVQENWQAQIASDGIA
jgi:hypothetical protein